MKLFVTIFACLVALATTKTALKHELEHQLDLVQSPMLTAIFDYKVRGYQHFVQILTSHLSVISLMRTKVKQLNEESDEALAKKLKDDINGLSIDIAHIIKDPAPKEMLKAHALFLAKIDVIENTAEFKQGRPEKLKKLVADIVADEVALQSISQSSRPNMEHLAKDLSDKYAEVKAMIAHQKIPTNEEIENFVPLTQKKIDELKYLPETVREALYLTDVLHQYQTLSYSLAQSLPIDTPEKVVQYFRDVGVFYQLLKVVYKFDMEGH